jgi:hypothetical protein
LYFLVNALDCADKRAITEKIIYTYFFRFMIGKTTIIKLYSIMYKKVRPFLNRQDTERLYKKDKMIHFVVRNIPEELQKSTCP